MNDHLGAAREYAAWGWPVFPIRPGTKRPATTHGFQDATTDTDRIENWWTGDPDAGIGIATAAAGLVIIDIDPCDGIRIINRETNPEIEVIGTDGWASYCELVPPGCETATLEVGTPSGGAHLYFLAPDGDPIKSSVSKIAPGVDVRAHGGYVIAPPTPGYTLDADLPPAALPEWLDRLLRPAPAAARQPAPVARPRGRGYAQAALTDECHAVRTAPVGTRNHTLNRAAFNLGTLAASGDIDAHRAMDELYLAARDAGLGEREAVATIRSGIESGLLQPRTHAA